MVRKECDKVSIRSRYLHFLHISSSVSTCSPSRPPRSSNNTHLCMSDILWIKQLLPFPWPIQLELAATWASAENKWIDTIHFYRDSSLLDALETWSYSDRRGIEKRLKERMRWRDRDCWRDRQRKWVVLTTRALFTATSIPHYVLAFPFPAVWLSSLLIVHNRFKHTLCSCLHQLFPIVLAGGICNCCQGNVCGTMVKYITIDSSWALALLWDRWCAYWREGAGKRDERQWDAKRREEIDREKVVTLVNNSLLPLGLSLFTVFLYSFSILY